MQAAARYTASCRRVFSQTSTSRPSARPWQARQAGISSSGRVLSKYFGRPPAEPSEPKEINWATLDFKPPHSFEEFAAKHEQWLKEQEQKKWKGRGVRTSNKPPKDMRAKKGNIARLMGLPEDDIASRRLTQEEARKRDSLMGHYAKRGKGRLFGAEPYQGRDNFGRGPSQYAKVKKMRKKGHKKIKATSSPEIFRVQRVLARTLRDAQKEKDAEQAERVMADVLEHPHSDAVIDLMTYNSAIEVFAKCQKWEKAVDMLEYMRSPRGSHKPDIYTYNSAIRACRNCGQWEMAMKLLRQMETEDSIPPDITNFNTAMKACVAGRQWEQALALLAEIRATDGIEPNDVSYSTAISACGGCGDVQQVLDLLNEMDKAGLKPNVVAYTSAMEACLNCGQWETALDVFDKIHARKGVEPNVVTYNRAIEACGAAGGARWEKALHLFRQMQSEKIRPNVVTYRKTIQALAEADRWEDACTVLGEMKTKHGIRPKKPVVYLATMRACSAGGQPEKLVEIFEQTLGEGVVKPPITMYNMAIDAYRSMGECKKVSDVLEAMKTRDVRPSLETYSSVIQSLAEHGQWQRALDVLTEMELMIHEPDAELYKAAVRSCDDARQSAKASDVLAEMQAAGNVPASNSPSSGLLSNL